MMLVIKPCCVFVSVGDGPAAAEGPVQQCQHHAAGAGGGRTAAQARLEGLSALGHGGQQQ